MKIYCPKCRWEPNRSSRWRCDPGCQHVWHTFETYGQCPGCGYVWRETQCCSCKAVSPHHHWYHDEEDISLRIGELAEQEKPGGER